MSRSIFCQASVASVTPDTTLTFVTGLVKSKDRGCMVIAEEQKPGWDSHGP